jgi:hypothetical protein
MQNVLRFGREIRGVEQGFVEKGVKTGFRVQVSEPLIGVGNSPNLASLLPDHSELSPYSWILSPET